MMAGRRRRGARGGLGGIRQLRSHPVVRFAAVAAAVLLSCAGVAAPAAAGEGEVGVGAGWHGFSSLSELGRQVGEPGRVLDAGQGGGPRASWWWTDPGPGALGAGVEGEVLWITTNRGPPGGSLALASRIHTATARAAIVAAVTDRVQGVFFGGVGAIALLSAGGTPDRDVDAVSHLGAGVRWAIGQDLVGRADLRAVVASSAHKATRFVAEPALQVGIAARFGRHRPPPPPPPPPADADADGLPDDLDVCPLVAETRNGIRDDDGCPEAAEVLARGATTTDVEEKVADGDAAIDHWAKTLPPIRPRSDLDHDGVSGDDDHCPDLAEDQDGFDDLDGCPDPDDDEDGVPDEVDRCRVEAEVWNGYDDGDGCPDEVPRPLKRYTGVIEGIFFRTRSAEIERKSNKVLSVAAAVLAEYPDVRVEIGGHTDDVGTADDNLALSQRRADAVRAWLVARGLAAERLVAKGYGLSRPRSAGRDGKSRALNRRVEFLLIQAQP